MIFVFSLRKKTTKETRNEEKYPSRNLVVHYYSIFTNIRR